MEYHFDTVSKLWLQPSSVIIDWLFPIEYVFGEWMFRQAGHYSLSVDKEFLGSIAETDIYSGSTAEGLAIPRLFIKKESSCVKNRNIDKTDYWIADQDQMSVCEIDVEHDGHTLIPIATIDKCIDDTRYVKLRITDAWKTHHSCYKDMYYLPHSYCLEEEKWEHITKLTKDNTAEDSHEIHGPVQKLQVSAQFVLGWKQVLWEKDVCKVLKYPTAWPEDAMDWLVRSRSHMWPTAEVIQNIFDCGCHLAPVGRGIRTENPCSLLKVFKQPEMYKNCSNGSDEMDNNEWRISFTVAENKLGQALYPIQRYVFVVLKMIKKSYFSDVICTYHLKNLLFWECEERCKTFWKEQNITFCIIKILDRLEECLRKGHLPHYIMSNSNLLEGLDSVKRENAIEAVGNIRKNILHKTANLLQRSASYAYLTSVYHGNMDFTTYVMKAEDNSMKLPEVEEFLISLYSLVIKQTVNALKSMQRTYESAVTVEDKELMTIPLCIYQSVLARNLCKLYFSRHREENSKKIFREFIEVEVGEVSVGEDFLAIAFEFYGLLESGVDLASAIPDTSAIKKIKDIEVKIACQGVKEMPKIDWLHTSDYKSIEKKVSDKIKSLNISAKDITEEDIEDMISKEKALLYEQRRQCDEPDTEGAISGIKYSLNTTARVTANFHAGEITKEQLSEALKLVVHSDYC